MIIGLKNLAVQIGLSLDRRHQNNVKQASSSVIAHNEPAQEKQTSQEIDVQSILPGLQSLAGIREVLDKIVKGVVEGLDYAGAMLAVLDHKNQTLTIRTIAFNDFICQMNLGGRIEGLGEIQVIGSSASLVHDQENLGVKTCLTGQTTVTHNLYDLFQPVVDQELSHRIQRITGVKTCISIPLLLEGRVVGNLCAGTKKKKISQKDLDALHFFVTNAAIAVQNSVLFERVTRKLVLRETELNQLREIAKMVSSSLDLEEVLKRILDGAIKLTKAEYGHVVLADNYGSDLVQRVSYPEGPKILKGGAFGITQLVMRDKKAKLIEHPNLVEPGGKNIACLTEHDYDLYSYSQTKSQLGVPISLGDELIGVIHIASKKPKAFNKRALDMLEQLAVKAAIAIRNAHQFKVEREMRERFANLAQVVAMGDMASNMVHSINNWVGSIRLDLHYLKRQHALAKIDPKEFAELLDDMLDNTEATLAMAENIRKPFQGLNPEPVSVSECIINVLQAKEEECSQVAVIKDLADLPPVLATRQLELVFENLLNNALQAMKGKAFGILKFATRYSSDRQWVEIIVKDSGPGLPEHLNEIEIFKLGVSGRKDGVGYGLWWCDTFLKRWGGNIDLVENTKTGCRFLIRLPVSTTL
jgi:GAF domain-containing protein